MPLGCRSCCRSDWCCKVTDAPVRSNGVSYSAPRPKTDFSYPHIVHNAYRIELSGETLRDRIDDTVDAGEGKRD